MKEKELERLTKIKEIEKDLYNKGFNNICGIDEAGRGPLCGPVVAGAVILPKNYELEGLNDSKKLSEKKREKFMFMYRTLKVHSRSCTCLTDRICLMTKKPATASPGAC